MPLLQSLLPGERNSLAEALRPLKFSDGEKIVTIGETGDAMYFIQSGKVRR